MGRLKFYCIYLLLVAASVFGCVKLWNKKQYIWIGAILLALIVILIIRLIYVKIKKRRPVGISSEDALASKAENVEKALKESGFSNIKLIPLNDLDYENRGDKGRIVAMTVGNDLEFQAKDKYPYDVLISLTYHSMKLSLSPIPRRKVGDWTYSEAYKIFESAGFKNIETMPEDDLVKGWLKKEDGVSEIIIEGNPKYSSKKEYPVDSQIIIKYHSFKEQDTEE